MPRRTSVRPKRAVAAAIAMCFIGADPHWLRPTSGAGLCLFVGLVFGAATGRLAFLNFRPLVLVGQASYSLYLIHLPIGVFVGGVLERLGWPATLIAPGPAAYAAFALIVAIALACAYLFAQLTEKHTARFRRFLSKPF